MKNPIRGDEVRPGATMATIDDLPFDPRKLPDEHLRVPDLADAVEGWRSWKVAREIPRYGVSPKLYSVVWDYYWTPRRAALAECCKSCSAMKIPGENCTCGFYSAKSLEHLLTMPYTNPDDQYIRVIGQVANWGKVIEGALGWRSSHSYPKKLWIPYENAELAEPLKEGYGVDVGLNFITANIDKENNEWT